MPAAEVKDDMHDIENDGLIEKMRALSGSHIVNLPTEARSNLSTLAFALEQAIIAGNTQGTVSAWVRARQYYCACSGEALA
jgi:hypothetical protein